MQRTLVAVSALGLSFLATPLRAADPFTLIVVPDTQNYTDFDNINDQYNIGQMNWIADQYKNNTSNLNVKFVMHMGDLQNPGNPYRARTDDIYEPDFSRPLGDVSDKNTKWNRADAGIDVLDANNVPYSLVPGNHDYLDHNTKSEPWKYLKMFGPQRYINEQASWSPSKRTYGGASPAHPVNNYAGMNTYHRFDAGGYTFLNLALQYDPDDHDLRWAQQIINENPGLPTIVTTHSYVNTGPGPGGNDYQRPDIFNKLVKNNPQIVMTFNGHLTGSNYVAGTNIAGDTAHQLLFDAQASDLDAQLDGSYYRGGGVLRRVQFEPDNDRVVIRDYSPIANKFLPRNFTAPDRNGTGDATYSTPASLSLDLVDRFGLPDKGGFTYTTSLRVGVNGYQEASVVDTYIDESATGDKHKQDTFAWVDGNVTNGLERQALIRFDLFGAGEIPRGSMIESATLTLHTSNNSIVPNSQTTTPVSIYRLLQTFGEDDNWNTRDGYLTDGVEAILAASGVVSSATQGSFVSFDVTESLSTYSDGATNHGWLLRAGNDGWAFDTSEHGTISFRPQLSVTYRTITAVPEPGSVIGLAGLATLMLVRRRRNVAAA